MSGGLVSAVTRGVSRRLGFGRRKVKKSYGKRRLRARYNAFKPRVLSLRSPGVPTKIITRLRYCDSKTLGNGTTTIGSHTFRCNSVYDPDFTGTGHQPLYHDQMSLLYQNYKVLKARIVAKGMSSQGVTLGNICFGLDILDSDNTVDTDPNTIRERAGSKYKTITPQMPQTVTGGWNLKKSKVSDEDGYTALCTANPSNVDYFRIYSFSADGSSLLGSSVCSVQIEIDYVVEYFNPVMVSGS